MKIQWRDLIRDVAIIALFTLVGGGFMVSIWGGQKDQTRIVFAVSNILFGIIGFTISGCLAKVDRFKHLFIVAISLWILTLFNVLISGAPFISWFLGIIPILIMMGVGGALSFLFVRPSKSSEHKTQNGKSLET